MGAGARRPRQAWLHRQPVRSLRRKQGNQCQPANSWVGLWRLSSIARRPRCERRVCTVVRPQVWQARRSSCELRSSARLAVYAAGLLDQEQGEDQQARICGEDDQRADSQIFWYSRDNSGQLSFRHQRSRRVSDRGRGRHIPPHHEKGAVPVDARASQHLSCRGIPGNACQGKQYARPEEDGAWDPILARNAQSFPHPGGWQ